MILKLENDFLAVEINSLGAELNSIKSKKTGIEYLWQGNPEFWKDKSPILFPLCGRLFGGKYTYCGAEYEMPIHGIARLFDIDYKKVSDREIEFYFKSSEQTKSYYPFDFDFIIRYVLDGECLKTEFIVVNTGKEHMYFSYGGHPGFNVPFNDGEKFEDYYLEFNEDKLTRLVFSPTCFCTGKSEEYILDDKKLALRHNLFDNDALFFELKADTVKLKSQTHKNSVEVSFDDMTVLGLWHKPKADVPYVCIEPWHGVPSTDGVVDDIKTKNEMIKLDVNGKYENSYTIKIIEG